MARKEKSKSIKPTRKQRTANKAKAGQKEVQWAVFIAQLWFGQDKQRRTFALNFNKIFLIISGCEQAEVYFPAFANTRSLAARMLWA